jgi:valyl-tRNA synthetase
VGNVVTPMPLLENHGADALRYWAASGRPGTDTAIDEAQMKIGRRLAIKVLNASKFVLGRLEGTPATSISDVSEPLDLDLLALLANLIGDATKAFDEYDYARALERTEAFFWSFCDDYLELVKIRAYGDADDAPTRSAKATLAIALSVLQRLLAPFIPFVSEEVWRWWHDGSVHVAAWPALDELRTAPVAGSVFATLREVLEAVRREKSTAKVSQRAEVELVTISAPAEFLDDVRAGQGDLKDAGAIRELELIEAADVAFSVSLVQA